MYSQNIFIYVSSTIYFVLESMCLTRLTNIQVCMNIRTWNILNHKMRSKNDETIPVSNFCFLTLSRTSSRLSLGAPSSPCFLFLLDSLSTSGVSLESAIGGVMESLGLLPELVPARSVPFPNSCIAVFASNRPSFHIEITFCATLETVWIMEWQLQIGVLCCVQMNWINHVFVWTFLVATQVYRNGSTIGHTFRKKKGKSYHKIKSTNGIPLQLGCRWRQSRYWGCRNRHCRGCLISSLFFWPRKWCCNVSHKLLNFLPWCFQSLLCKHLAAFRWGSNFPLWILGRLQQSCWDKQLSYRLYTCMHAKL